MKSAQRLELNLLLFSVGGVSFGVDADQVSEVQAYDGEKGEDLFWFHEQLPCCDGSIPYSCPTVISIRTGEERPHRVIIDRMEDVGTFAASDLRLFPALVEPFALRNGMWGILLRNGRVVLLLDFGLLGSKRAGASLTGNGEPVVPLL